MENMIQLTERRHFADSLYFEYGQSLTRGEAAGSNQITFGPINCQEFGRTVHTMNVLTAVGPDQTSQGLVSTVAKAMEHLDASVPAIEILATPNSGSVPRLAQRNCSSAGRRRTTAVRSTGLGHRASWKYEIAGVGTTPAMPAALSAGRWRWKFRSGRRGERTGRR